MVSILGKEKLISRIICNILAVAAISVVGYYIINGTWFGTDALLAVMQTNRIESLEYIAGNGRLRLVFAMMLLFI